MAKKPYQPSIPASPTPSTQVPSRDVLQRLNYLYQASRYLNTVLPSRIALSEGEQERRKMRKEKAKSKQQELRNEAIVALAGAREISGTRFIPTQHPGIEIRGLAGAETAMDEDRSEVGLASCSTSALTPVTTDAFNSNSTSEATFDDRRSRKRPRPNGKDKAIPSISRSLSGMMNSVAQKATLRMDPSVKRTLCKNCRTVLISGTTSSVRIKPSGPHGHIVVHSCLSCGHQRRLPAPPVLASSATTSLPEPPAAHTTSSLSCEKIPVGKSSEVAGEADRKGVLTKRELRRGRKRPVFFERSDHVVVAGDRVIERRQ